MHSNDGGHSDSTIEIYVLEKHALALAYGWFHSLMPSDISTVEIGKWYGLWV